MPSSLMLGVTTHLSTDVGSFPLMWVAPLAIYLATFIAVFARTPPAPGPRVVAPFLSLLVLMFLFTAPQVATRLPLVIGHLALFAWCAYLLHGSLARTREDSGSVTSFQLALAVGGALGGAFNTLVAPHVFTRVTEYPLAMALAVLLLPPPPPPPDSREREEQLLRSVGLDPDAVLGPKRAPKRPPRFTIVDAMVPLAVGMLATLLFLTPMTARAPSLVRYGLPLIALVLLSIGQRIRLALGLVAILAAAKADPSVVYADRTFFGVLRVEDVHGVRRFMHGTTLHGLELLSNKDHGIPLAYYASTGPIGRAMTALTPSLQGRSVGVVGLGVGMLIAYAQPSQRWTFYELDPAVEHVARRYFTWLRDARAPWSVVTGDARRTLARDATARHGLLVLDAFSSDSIPVHLLTREALDLYRQRIDEHGVIAFHVTNRHVALDGVIAALARDAGMVAVRGRGRTLGPDGLVTTTWVLLARRGEDLGPLWGDPRWRRVDQRETRRAWTDDRSDLIGVMRWR
ncbi:MAG: fused MFS/spermidine synthase [Polyangiales bacterium]